MRVRGPDDCTPVDCLRSCSTTAQLGLLTACSRGRRTVRSCGRLLVRPVVTASRHKLDRPSGFGFRERIRDTRVQFTKLHDRRIPTRYPNLAS